MKNKLALNLTVFLLIGGCFSACKLPDGNRVEFAIRYPEANQVNRLLESDRRDLVGYQPTGVANKVMESFFQFNRATVFSKYDLNQTELYMRQLEMSISRCLEDKGKEALQLLVFWLTERFEERFRALAEASRDKDIAKALVAGNRPIGKPGETTERLVEVVGDFLTHAAKSGLLELSSEKGIQYKQESIFFMRLAFKVRWSRILPEQTMPLSFLLSDFEREWYEVWVVERSKSASLQRKLDAIDRLVVRDPDYPKHLGRGIVFYQNRLYKKSADEFEKAQEKAPQDQRIKNYLKKARRKAK